MLAIPSLPVSANYSFTTSLRVAKRVDLLVIILTVSSIVTLALAFVLSPMFGIWGAALELVLG